jgi:hypothetical protein
MLLPLPLGQLRISGMLREQILPRAQEVHIVITMAIPVIPAWLLFQV